MKQGKNFKTMVDKLFVTLTGNFCTVLSKMCCHSFASLLEMNT